MFICKLVNVYKGAAIAGYNNSLERKKKVLGDGYRKFGKISGNFPGRRYSNHAQ